MIAVLNHKDRTMKPQVTPGAMFPVGERMVFIRRGEPLPGGRSALHASWLPDRPKTLTPAEVAAFEAGRDEALTRLAALENTP